VAKQRHGLQIDTYRISHISHGVRAGGNELHINAEDRSRQGSVLPSHRIDPLESPDCLTQKTVLT
jgi:hypothetical protein